MLLTYRCLQAVHPSFAPVYALFEIADAQALADVIPENAITVVDPSIN